MKGASIKEVVLVDNLTSKEAYRIEHRNMEELVNNGKRDKAASVGRPFHASSGHAPGWAFVSSA